MKLLLYISDAIIPILLFIILFHALLGKGRVYEDFLEGAKDGFHTVIGIMPTLIGLMCAVGVLRASGFLTDLAVWVGKDHTRGSLSLRASSSGYRKNVFLLGGDRTGLRYF